MELKTHGIMNVGNKTAVNCVYEAEKGKYFVKGNNIEIEFMSGKKVVSKINDLHVSVTQFSKPVLSIVIDEWIDENECGKIKKAQIYN